MAICDDIRGRLYSHAEGETGPADALMIARHLPTCTACRILLARERRLAEFLESDLPDLPVGEEFVEAVMSRLPDDPPRRRMRRGLKLAGLALLGFAPALGLTRLGDAAAGLSPLPSLPTPGPESADGALLGLQAAMQLAAVALNALGSVPQMLHSVPTPGQLALGLVLTGGCAVLATSTLIALAAAGTLLRRA